LGLPVRRQDITIPEPCHAAWDEMRPEDKGRFCFSCSKKVHDLSAMTKSEAAEVLRRAGRESLCVSFQHHEDGTVVFREPAPAPAASVVPLARLRRPRAVAAMVAGAGVAAALAACAPHAAEAPVRSQIAAEEPVFATPSVIVPHADMTEPPAASEREAPPETAEDEPCEPPTTKPDRPAAKPVLPRVKGGLRRTAGMPIPRGNDPLGL
jgi:hypothetical protein